MTLNKQGNLRILLKYCRITSFAKYQNQQENSFSWQVDGIIWNIGNELFHGCYNN